MKTLLRLLLDFALNALAMGLIMVSFITVGAGIWWLWKQMGL